MKPIDNIRWAYDGGFGNDLDSPIKKLYVVGNIQNQVFAVYHQKNADLQEDKVENGTFAIENVYDTFINALYDLFKRCGISLSGLNQDQIIEQIVQSDLNQRCKEDLLYQFVSEEMN